MAQQERDAEQFDSAVEMLEADHRKVRELFQRYEAAGNPDAKQQVAEQTFVELEVHAQLEEMVFYPAFEEAADEEGKQLVEEARQEHEEVKTLIEELRDLDDDETFDDQFRELMDNVEHHVQEEEAEMFPLAEKLLAERTTELAEEMQDIKTRLLTS
jgi:hemerythrin superfamily protein